MPEILKNFRRDVQNLVKLYHRPAIAFWTQAFWFFLRYGASPNDYIRYEFYLKNGRGVNEYITASRNKKVIMALNHERMGALEDDKYKTNCKFKKYISRDWIKVSNDSDTDEIVHFIERHDEIILKPLSLSGGKGIVKYECKTILNVREFVEKLKLNEFLIEESVKQHEEMNAFNPYSVNTLRIYTLCDKMGRITIVDSFVRMATKEIAVDNFHSGGCAAAIDIATGIVTSPAGDYERNYYIVSPVTQKIIIGRVIPSWEKAKVMCLEMAKALFKEEKRYIAFDVAILQNGEPELIEINWFGDSVIRQLIGCRLRGKYQEVRDFL